MQQALTSATLAILVAGVAVVALLALRRLRLAREERRRMASEERMRDIALALVDGDEGDLPAVSDEDAVALARLLTRYAHLVDGAARGRIAAYFRDGGHLAAEVAALADRREWRRAAAAYALGDMGDDAVTALIDALRDPSRDVRAAATRGLGRLRAAAALQPLVMGITSGSIPAAVGGDALLAIARDAPDALRPLAAHPQPGVRRLVLDVMGLVGADDEAAEMAVHLRDPAPQVRAAAALALGRLAEETAATALRVAVSDPHASVRAAAAEALGMIGDADAIGVLMGQALLDEHDAAMAAAEAIAVLDPRRLAQAAAGGAGDRLAQAADQVALTGAAP